jgi:hypothetical protein
MVRMFILDKIVKQGVTYTTKEREVIVIKGLGTNSSGDARLIIDKKKLGYIDNEVSPLHVTSSNLLGPLSLEELYYVVPPETEFEIEGDSGSKGRIIGEHVYLAVGEATPSELIARFDLQHKQYKTKYDASWSLGTDVTWTADAEYEVLSLTPLTTEKIIVDGIILVSISGDTVAEGDFGIAFYVDNVPLEAFTATNLMDGIDSKSMPKPPADTTEELVFTLKEFPIEVLGDQTFSIRVRNTSGANKAPASGSSWTVKIKLIARYYKL